MIPRSVWLSCLCYAVHFTQCTCCWGSSGIWRVPIRDQQFFFCKGFHNILGFVTTYGLCYIFCFVICLLTCFTALKNIKTMSSWAVQSLSVGWIILWGVVFQTWFTKYLVIRASAVLLGICSVNGKFKSKLEISTDSHPELRGQGITLTSPQDLLQILLIPFSDFSGHTDFSECYPQLCYTFPQKNELHAAKQQEKGGGKNKRTLPTLWTKWTQLLVPLAGDTGVLSQLFGACTSAAAMQFHERCCPWSKAGREKMCHPKLSNL